MHAEPLLWAEDASDPLIPHFCFVDPAATTIMLGTGRFVAGQTLPTSSNAQRRMREIGLILEGSVRTETNGKELVLKAGEIVTIPPNEDRVFHFLEDTRLVYLYFGHRAAACDADV